MITCMMKVKLRDLFGMSSYVAAFKYNKISAIKSCMYNTLTLENVVNKDIFIVCSEQPATVALIRYGIDGL